MTTTAYLNDENEKRAREIMKRGEYESISEAVAQSLKLLEKELRKQELAEKYREETPVSDSVIAAQEETLDDLDG